MYLQAETKQPAHKCDRETYQCNRQHTNHNSHIKFDRNPTLSPHNHYSITSALVHSLF